jgi:sulfhydrogenase subunit alpha
MSEAGSKAGRRIVVVDHLARVEGHGGITVELDGEGVGDVRFDVFEGIRLIEALIGGRSWEDVSPIVSRICAICSVAHSLTSLRVTERVFGVATSPRTEMLRDLLWRGENVESHALHLFLLAAPDYLGYPSAPALAASAPEAVKVGLRLKKLGNRIQEVVGGRAIHPVNAVPGGFGTPPGPAELVGLRRELEAGRQDVEAALAFMKALPAQTPMSVDTTYLALRPETGYGYDGGSEVVVVRDGRRTAVPAEEVRRVAVERPVPHSHAKHTLLDGRPFMVGALARLVVNHDRLPDRGTKLVEELEIPLPSGDPLDNNKAQAVELALDVDRALDLVDALLADAAPVEERPVVRPRAGSATVITEAPRGILLHAYTYDDAGRVVSADVVTPTAFNAASLEAHMRAAVATEGVQDEERLRRRLEMIVRAYDPCISCSVHVVRRR